MIRPAGLAALALAALVLGAAPASRAETLTVETPQPPNHDPDTGGHPDAILSFPWVLEVRATCVADDPGAPPPRVTATIETPGPVSLSRLDESFDAYPRLHRDARGRPGPSAFAYGALHTWLVIEHLAGERVPLVITCGEQTWRETGRVSTSPPSGWRASSLAADDGCGASGGAGGAGLVPALLALGWLGARRRRARVREALLAAAAAAAVLAGCGDGDAGAAGPVAGQLFAGVGEPSALPLWPLGEGIRPTFRRTIAFDEAHLLNRLLPDLTSAHSARRVARGVLHRFDRSFDATDSGGVGVIATDDGDVYLAEDHAGPIDPPILLVPREVRLGMSWTANRQLERGSVFAFGNGGAADGAVRWDPADTWRFTVTQRQPVATVYGERVLWRVEWVGPPVPVPRNHTTTRSPADEIYRIRGAIDFLEGHGPVAGQPWLYALDTLLSYGPAPNDPQEPELAPFAAEDPELVDPDGRPVTLAHLGFPAPPDLTDAGVLGAVPQEAPDLALTELGDGPLVEDIAPERVWSVTSSQGDALTDLLVRGRSTGRNGILGPNGETLAVNQTVLAAACAYLEPDGTPSATPFPPELCTRRESPAHLDTYVHPDGTRWTPIDTVRVNEVREATPGASGERLLGGTAYASWWRDGRFLSLVTAVAGSWIADWDGEKTPDTSLPTGFVAAPVPGVPVATDDVFGVRYTAMIAAATLPDGVALVSLSRYVRDQPAEIAWIADDGTVRDRVAFPAFGVSRAHEDGAYRFAAVGQAGELTALRVEDTGVFPELRGRLALPAGHIAVGALQVADDRFLVLTQEAPELRFVALAASYSSRLDMSPRPAKIGAVHLHEVTAPATGALDEAFAARLVAVTRAPHAVSICVPAATGWRAARVRLGDREVAAAELVDVGDGCQLARVTDDDAARADLFGWLPVGVLFEGVGWVFRALPALADPPTPWPPGAAPLADGSRLTPDAWEAPLGARRLAASNAVPGVLRADPLAHPSEGIGTDRMSPVPDAAGAGLWFVDLACFGGGDDCWVGRPPDLGDDAAPYVLADRWGRRTLWGPPGMRWAADGGGLIGGGHRLDEDGTVSEVPGGAATEAAFDAVRHVFSDGTTCGEIDDALACAAPGGEPRAFPGAAAWAHVAYGQAPASLVGVAVADDAAFVDVLDARSGEAQRVPLGAAGAATTVSGPTPSVDGALWWTVGAPLDLLVSVKGGAVATYPLDEGQDALWSASPERLVWTSGAVTPTPGSDGCLAVSERCNGRDDDCDGATDEVEAGEAALCDDSHGAVACVAGACVVGGCDGGWDDCNGAAVDGCERALGTPADCLACGDRCPTGAACDAVAGCGAKPPPALVAGQRHMCALDAIGRVTCWGFPSGFRGDSEALAPEEDPDGPFALTGFPAPVVALAAGLYHTCARLAGGGVACVGHGGGVGPGQGGDGFANTPVAVPGVAGVTALAAGFDSTCAVAAGELWCWGDALWPLNGAIALEPTRVGDVADAVAVALSGTTVCVVRAGGALSCGGGLYDPDDRGEGALRELSGLAPVTRLWGAAGASLGDTAFVLETTDGMLGLGHLGGHAVLGGPAAATWLTPARIPAADGAADVVLGPQHLCLLDASGARCAGQGQSYQLGTGFTASHEQDFVVHTHAAGWVGGAATQRGTCLVAADATLWCAGLAEAVGAGRAGAAGQPQKTLAELPLLPD